jgi:hypothetical protein
MNTLVISAFPCCGKSYAFEHYQNTYEILDSDSSNFSWMERVRTEEELEECGKTYDELGPHMLPTDAYINRIRNELIKVRNPEFPNNYIQHIKEAIEKDVDIIFVSSHLAVRQALYDANISYITVYPEQRCLDEWVGRMYRRGSDKAFIDFQIKHWDEFTNNIDNEPHGLFVYRLEHNQYLTPFVIDKLRICQEIKLKEMEN